MEADGNVLTVTTNSLNAAFKNELCEPVASIIDVNCGAADEKPVGTGPYKIDSVADNGDVELSSYDSYWQGNPTIKTVHAKYLTDDQSKVSALQSGEVSALMNVADDQLSAFERHLQIHAASDQPGSCPYAVLQHAEQHYAGRCGA